MATSKAAARTYAGEYQAVFAAVANAVQSLGMTVVGADPATGTVTARSSMSVATWGEKVEIQVGQAAPGSVQVSIRSALKFGLVDWGKNQKNLDRLFAAVDQALAGGPAPAGGPTPAGWHPDPAGRHEHRYWDGTTWTDQVSDSGAVSSDPPPGG